MSKSHPPEDVVRVIVVEADTSVIDSDLREQLSGVRQTLGAEKRRAIDKALIDTCCTKNGNIVPWLMQGANPHARAIINLKTREVHFALSLAADYKNSEAVICLLKAGVGEILPVDPSEPAEVGEARQTRLDTLNDAIAKASANRANKVMGILLHHIKTYVPEEFWPKIPNFGLHFEIQAAMLGVTRPTTLLGTTPQTTNPNRVVASALIQKALKALL